MREAQQIKQLEATGSHNPLTLELLPRAQNPQKKTKRKDLLDSRDGDEDGVIPSFRELEAKSRRSAMGSSPGKSSCALNGEEA
jgi:hypothetical protein